MLSVVAGVLVYGLRVHGVEKALPVSGEFSPVSGELRADIIAIDGLKVFGKLDRPAVIFLHEAHTEALKKKDKDCKACHLVEKDRPALAEQEALSVRFKRLKEVSRDVAMEIYHTECIACHREMAAAKEKTGPVEVCGDCHKEKPSLVSSRQPLKMDKSLHARHVEATRDKKASKDRCDLCHHQYDEIAKKITYVKEKESSCRYCHKGEPGVTEKDRMAMREASHLSCVNCHRKTLAEKKDPAQKVGAITCGGCHDPKNQAKIEKLKVIPRIDRKQPDYVLLTPVRKLVADAEERKRQGFAGWLLSPLITRPMKDTTTRAWAVIMPISIPAVRHAILSRV